MGQGNKAARSIDGKFWVEISNTGLEGDHNAISYGGNYFFIGRILKACADL